MEGATKLITFGIALGLALAKIGALPQATLWMFRQASVAQPQMISLSKLNRALHSGGGHRHRHSDRTTSSKP
jgi:hypothetical protein